MEFARLPIISMVGVFVYAEVLDPAVFIGAAVIFAANFWNMRASQRAASRTTGSPLS